MKRIHHKSQRGVALLLCLFSLMLVSAVGLGLMFMSDTETSINDNYRASQAAYYASKAGLEEMRERMRYGASSPIPTPTVLPGLSAPTGVQYVINSDGGTAIQPWNASNTYFDDELCHENYSGLGLTAVARNIPCSVAPSGSNWYTSYTSNDPRTGTAGAFAYKWVRMTIKQNGSQNPYCVDGTCSSSALGRTICWDAISGAEKLLPTGVTSCEAASPPMRTVYLLTALAVTRTGSRRMTQYEVASTWLPPLPAAVTFDGVSPVFNAPNSNSLTVNGNDQNSCGVGGANFPGLGAYDASSVSTLASDIPNHRDHNYTGSSGSTPDIQNVGPTGSDLLASMATVGGLQNLVANITSTADRVYNGTPPGSNINLGSNTNPLVTVVNGDFDMGNAQNGAGLLLVTGTLTWSGNPNFNGIILVIGRGTITTANGSGNGYLNGAMLVANLYDSYGNLLPSTSPPGVPSANFNGGGNFTFHYDSCWITNLSNKLVFHIIASREEIY